jgi:hypothetical protein
MNEGLLVGSLGVRQAWMSPRIPLPHKNPTATWVLKSRSIPLVLPTFTKTELQEIVYQLAAGQLRQRLEAALTAEGWAIDGSALRFAITNGSTVSGARLVKGDHVRLR